MGKKAVIILSKIKTDGRDWHTCIQIRACLTFNLLWMADPRWWWDSAAQFQTQHLFSFCSNVLCQLQLFYLVGNANIIKMGKKAIMKTGSLILWKWGTWNISNQVQTFSHTLHHSSHFEFCTTILLSHKWHGDKASLKRGT